MESRDPQANLPALPNAWVPYAVTLGTILVSIILFYFVKSVPTSDVVVPIFSGVILALGCSFGVLLGLIIRLTQLTHQRKLLFEIINKEFEQEMADRIHAEETKQKLEKELLQGQKLQAIGTLAGGIAHDFNNLLYAIIGYVEMAREDVAKDSLLHKNLGKVLEASKRGQELVSRILSFSRKQHHDLKPIFIKETIEGALALLRPTIPSSVTIQFDSMTSDCHISGNQTQLHQVMVNLINNAVDAMDGEGAVKISLHLIPSTDPLLHQFSNVAPVSYCKIMMRDTGHGMDQTTIERMFEPFYTTKEVGKGTGLGLATVHTIIKEHQGEILVESQLGHGTTFTILLPEFKENQHG